MLFDAWYAERPARARSPEVDYGVMWWDDSLVISHTLPLAPSYRWPQHRVSWVEYTGEFYALNLVTMTVEVLGFAPTRLAAEAALADWADGPLGYTPLSWARERLAGSLPKVPDL